MHLATDHIVDPLSRTFVGNVGEFDVGFALQKFGGQVGHGAVARGSVVDKARLPFGGVDHIAQITKW